MQKIWTRYAFSEKQFDALMVVLDGGIENLEEYTKEDGDTSMLDALKKIKEWILKYSIFDIEEEKVYIDLTDCDLIDIKYAFYLYVVGTYRYFVDKPTTSFQDMIKKDTTRML